MAKLKTVTRNLGPANESAATETVDLSLRLLERLASSKESLGISELAREFASSKATVYRHLQALMLHGFVHQEPTTLRYAAGIKLFILGERLSGLSSWLTQASERPARAGLLAHRPVSGVLEFNSKFGIFDKSLWSVLRKFPFRGDREWRLVRSSTGRPTCQAQQPKSLVRKKPITT